MHLAIVTPFPPRLTGIGQYGYFVSRALASSGAFKKISLITEAVPPGCTSQNHDPISNETWQGVDPRRVWSPGRLDAGIQIFKEVKRAAPDLVWFNLGISTFGRSPLANLAGLMSPAVCHSAGFLTIVTLHELIEKGNLRSLKAPGGPLAGAGAGLITQFYTHADLVCVTLRHQMEWLQQRQPGRRLAYIPHGSFEPPRPLPEHSGLELLFFGTHSPFKGLELLLHSFAGVRQHYPGLKLTIAGAEHPRFPGFLQQVKDDFRSLPGVNWLGTLSEQELAAVFGQASMVVLPYTATTGSSSVLYRAAAWGRPVVASNLPELRAAAAEGGLRVEHFQAGDSDSLTAALLRMLENTTLRKSQAMHNLRSVERQTLADTCRAYLHAFDLALSHRAGAAKAVPPNSKMNTWFNLE